MPSDASYRVGGGAPFAFGPRAVSLVIAAMSALTLAAALSLEHIGGFRPCHLCLEERIPHYAAVPAALLAFLLARTRGGITRAILALIVLGFLYNAGLSFFHVGVEQHWWPGPDTCTGVGSIASSPADLMKSLASGGNVVVRCDEVPLRILGLSLAAYGGMLSAFLALLACAAALGFDPIGQVLARLGLSATR